ncbi:hypothetical protein JD844_033425 [Phrynosoma platyrhinos]|uniref:High affinity choline transporter 1 n=1 Tax=Phrynosoma platyrhinos TaxID=52577 RepID=A0ABQ7T633_PHRPL|nr:hypothetical protein JD844_033425 [Phrynosoma platyrhinos]
MRKKNYVTMMDPIQEAYGNVMATLLFIPPLIADIFWFAAILASLDWNQTDYGLPAPNERGESALILPLVLRYLCPMYISVSGLAAIAAAVMSSGDSALLSASSMFAHNIYRKVLREKASCYFILQTMQKQAREKDVLWAMRVATVAFGIMATALAFYSHSIYDLWFLGGELVYALLFPQLCCVLFIPSTNTYGSAAGFLVGFVLRLLAGEPALKIPPVLCYLGCSLVDGTYIQLFPFKIITMLITLLTIVSISYLASFVFKRNILPIRWDVCKIVKEDKVVISLCQREEWRTVQNNENYEQVQKANCDGGL